METALSKSSLSFVFDLDAKKIQLTIKIFLLIDMISQIFGLYMLVFAPTGDDYQIVMFGFVVTLLLFVMSIAPTNVHSLRGLEVSRTFVSFRFVCGFQAVALCFRLRFNVGAIAWMTFHWLYLSFTVGVLLATMRKYRQPKEPKPATETRRQVV